MTKFPLKNTENMVGSFILRIFLTFEFKLVYSQKQPFVVVFQKIRSEKFRKIYRKHLCESVSLNKVTCRLATASKISPRWRYFSIKFANFLRTAVLRTTASIFIKNSGFNFSQTKAAV